MSRSSSRRSRTGFTLIEVLLVLAIIGVIMALVVPQLLGRQRQANVQATQASIGGLESALKIYAVDHDGEFPLTNPGLSALTDPQPNDPKWNGPYIEEKKADQGLLNDLWGQPLQYEYPGSHNVTKPDIWSWGADRQNGTGDDITNW